MRRGWDGRVGHSRRNASAWNGAGFRLQECGVADFGGYGAVRRQVCAAQLSRHCVEILRVLGGRVTQVADVLSVDTRDLCRCTVPGYLMRKMRASVLFLGPLLARFGCAELTMPGGCPLGGRPIDLHLEAMSRMGAAVTWMEENICCRGPVLHGCSITFRFPSVGATENALMAAVGCHGTVTIYNAAREPEVSDLIVFLQAMGADIQGAGTDTLTVTGSGALHDADYTVMFDRIEAATYLCAAAGCGGEVTLIGAQENCLVPVTDVLRRAGCEIKEEGGALILQSTGVLTAVGEIETGPYPGFPTDVQAPMMAALLRAKGCTRFSETVFENRFGHIVELQRFGANIDRTGTAAQVTGVERLHGAQAEACDLRAAAALILAALQAQGESRIYGLKHLYRGYANPVEKLSSLGASLRCVQ